MEHAQHQTLRRFRCRNQPFECGSRDVMWRAGHRAALAACVLAMAVRVAPTRAQDNEAFLGLELLDRIARRFFHQRPNAKVPRSTLEANGGSDAGE